MKRKIKTKPKKNKIMEHKENKPRFELLSHDERFLTANTYGTLRTALAQAEESEEQVVAIYHNVECFPTDGVVAFNRALKNVFGFTHAKAIGRPPQTINIETGVDKTEAFFYGAMMPPSFEGGSLTVEVTPPVGIAIHGKLKRKFSAKAEELVREVKRLIREESIYRGQAIEVDMTQSFPQPKFIDLSREVDLILNADTRFELETNVWDCLRRPDAFRANKVPLKHGILCSGVYGTGKSLTSYVTAQIACKAGWTFLYLKKVGTANAFTAAYNICQLYAPAVLFVEDIDAITGGTRNAEMNLMLETLDGVGAKGKEVVTVFTTNFPEKINEAFLRSGRIDTHIEMGLPDAKSAAKFVTVLGGANVASDVDLNAAGEAFAGLVPADIAEGINKAKRRAIGVHGADINGKISTEMLVMAGEIMRKQRGLIKNKVDLNAEALAKVREGFGVVFNGQNGIIETGAGKAITARFGV